MRPESASLRFVRALLDGSEAVRHRDPDSYVAPGRRRLDLDRVHALSAQGVLTVTGDRCRATAEASSWARRQLLDGDAYADQHRDLEQVDGVTVNLAESPLARLAHAGAGEKRAYLDRHHVEAGERVRRLAEQAQLQPRVTMSYTSSRTAGDRSVGPSDISDIAAEARRSLAEIHRVLPRDCAGVVVDVCGLLKGLQVVEAERGWPRRSAKLVLRIALDRLAEHFGLSPVAVGQPSRRQRSWRDDGARPDRFE